jgi:hypothetical protein
MTSLAEWQEALVLQLAQTHKAADPEFLAVFFVTAEGSLIARYRGLLVREFSVIGEAFDRALSEVGAERVSRRVSRERQQGKVNTPSLPQEGPIQVA